MVTNMFAGVVASVVACYPVPQIQPVERLVSPRVATGTVVYAVATFRQVDVDAAVKPSKTTTVKPGVVEVRVTV